VAAENVTQEQLDEVVKIDIEATDYSYRNDCSNAGFEVDEKVTVRDLFYGTILPSGADAAYSLAVYVAGSHEAFVEKMNEKLAEMGLSETSHVTNCVGLYDDDHYSTPYDIAMILKAASDNDFCRQVLSTKKYTTSATKQHEEGLLISNWFLRRVEDQEIPGEVLCAKTGYVTQSGSCAASLARSESGKEYICVTAGSTSSWRCIYDHVDIYNAFIQ
jgi:D-alanyl-D-alanine carboxypeptidase (penicillin-binding protein 5/6)